MFRSTRSLPALVLAAVVMVVALAGASTAAKMITGKQIKNNTVTTKDIKNESLKGADVKNGNLTGADVKDGSLAPADLAASAKNVVAFVEGPDFNLPTCNDTDLETCPPIVSVPIPAGTWLVTANLTIDNFSGPATDISNRCALQRGNATLSEARTPLAANGAPGEAESITLQEVVTGGAPVSLRCTEMAGESFRVGSPTITALKVN